MNRSFRMALLALAVTGFAATTSQGGTQPVIHSGKSLAHAIQLNQWDFDGTQPPAPPQKPLAFDGTQPPAPPQKPLFLLDGTQPPAPPQKPLALDGTQPPAPPQKP